MYEHDFLQALLLTSIIETSLMFLMLRYAYRVPQSSLPTRIILFGGVLCSCATLPYVWFVFPAFISHFYAYTFVAEAFAVSAETIIIFFLLRLSLKRSFWLSVICNGCSFLVGQYVLQDFI
jgi:hypothetical protein